MQRWNSSQTLKRCFKITRVRCLEKICLDVALICQTVQKLLGINKDKERDELHSAFRELRADEACRWITDDINFLNWYDAPSSKQLVLLGDRGCGKTITTAYLVDQLVHLNKHQLPRPLICFHYCKDDETGKVEYVYCSLILQLLDQQEGLKVKFDKWYESTKKSGERMSPVRSFQELGSFFSTCVEGLDRQLFIIIDALDECDRQSRVKIVAFFDALSKRTPRLKVLFSCRPLEWVENTLGGVSQIRWKPNRERDAVIVKHTVENCLEGLDTATQSLVIEKLSDLADGSAIWVKLMVNFIQTRKIRSLGRMKVFLADIPAPAELSQLYARLFAQMTGDDSDNELVVGVALEVLAVAQRPLSILELGWAIALNDSMGKVHLVEELQDYVDAERVLSLVQPFISQVDFKDVRRRQVRLIHHSLKTLILQETPLKWAKLPKNNSVSQKEKQLVTLRQGKLESSLLRLCVKYLLLDDFDQRDLFSSDQQTAQVLHDLTTLGLPDEDSSSDSETASAERKSHPVFFDPFEHGFGGFFVYASCFWLAHFKAVALPQDLPSSSDLVKLCTAKSQRVKNWNEQRCRPDCTMTPMFKFDADSWDPLVVVSNFGTEAAVKNFLEECNVDNAEFLPDSVWEAAQWMLHEPSRLCLIFRDARVGPKIRNYQFFNRVMGASTRSPSNPSEWTCIFDLVSEIFDDLVKEKCGNEFLCLAAGHGCLPIVERLFGEASRNPDMKHELLRDRQRGSRAPYPHQSIGEAVWQGHLDVLHYMLKQDGIDAHLRHRDAQGHNVLHKAARPCNPEIMALLVSHFSEGVNQSSNSGSTPLHIVVFESRSTTGRIECAKILLTEGGADVRAGARGESGSWHEPLRMAARYGDVEMCRVLVEVGGADPRSVLRIESDGSASLRDPVDEVVSDGPVVEALCSLGGLGRPGGL
jgi:Ankyrin repeats (3 copies)/NACHT domain